MMRLLKDRRLLGSAAGVAVLLTIALWPASIAVEVATVQRGTLTVTVAEEGRTRVRDRFVVSSPVYGRVLRVELEPGDRVHRGDVVARVRPGMPPLIDARSHAEAQAAVRSAQAALGRARAEEQRANAALLHAARERDRSRRLASEGVTSVQEAETREDEARVAAEAANAATYAAQAAVADVEQAMARLESPVAAHGAAVVAVVSPADGVILRRLRESEAVVPAGEALVEIGDPSDLEVVVDLLSTDAARVRAGARALVSPWRNESPLDGRVRRIEPSGFTKVSALGVEEQRVNVILDLASAGESDSSLGDGYRVDAAIIVREVPRAVMVPTGALFREGDRWAVYEVRQGRARLVLVNIGEQTARQAEVIDGLDEGARVVVHPSDRVVDGVRVEVVGEEPPQ